MYDDLVRSRVLAVNAAWQGGLCRSAGFTRRPVRALEHTHTHTHTHTHRLLTRWFLLSPRTDAHIHVGVDLLLDQVEGLPDRAMGCDRDPRA